ncbi:MAG: tyrosine-type recombinase/integrase [Clostridiales bacterium]|nr:tyrosine-type recombinase/integrase [Clostridiales bacterium]
MVNIDRAENPDFLNDYILYLRVVKNCSRRTINEYYADIRLFLKYIRVMKDKDYSYESIDNVYINDLNISLIKNLSLHDFYEYVFYLADERDNNEKSRARKISSLKSFFNYLTNNVHLLENNPIANIEMPSQKKAIPKFLSLEESLKLLSNIDSVNPKRDYCIITLFLNCGMRLSELVGININDIDFTEKRIKLLGKGNKERMIYLNNACIDSINEYLNSRENPPNEPHALFLSKFKKRISKRRVQQIVENALKSADLDGLGYSTHKLRHTAATLMYQHGNVDTLVLKEVLGHESIVTTEIYTHISNKDLQKATDSSPLANIKKSDVKNNE